MGHPVAMDVPPAAAGGVPPSPPRVRPPFSIPTLRRAVTVLTLTRRLRSSPYIAVIALTGGHSWGRSNMRARLLPRPPPPPPLSPAGEGDGAATGATEVTGGTRTAATDGAPVVDAVRVAPWAARAAVTALAAESSGNAGGGGATPAAWTLLGHLFAGGAMAVIHGTTGEAVTGVLRRSRQHLRGGVLLGGMVGGRVVDATVWDRLVVRCGFVRGEEGGGGGSAVRGVRGVRATRRGGGGRMWGGLPVGGGYHGGCGWEGFPAGIPHPAIHPAT